MEKRHKTEGFTTMESIFSEQYPLSNYAFSLYLFVRKIYEQSMADGATDLFFLAREGQFLKKLYDCYTQNKPNACRSHYMYISRRAAVNASLNSLDEESFAALKSSYASLSVVGFLKSLNFSDEEITVCTENMSEEMAQSHFLNFFESAAFLQLRENAYFEKRYEEKRFVSHNNCLKYLRQIGFDTNNKIAVVDVGWSGTIQDALFRFSPQNELRGYYIGINSNAANADGNIKKGLLFEVDKAFAFERHNYEYVCVADHGATIAYDAEGIPVIEDDNDCDMYRTYFKNVQEAITKKFFKLDSIFNERPIDRVVENYFVYFHAKMFLPMGKRDFEIIRISKRMHADNYATGKQRNTVWVKKYLWYVREILNLKNLQSKAKKKIENEHK